MCFEISSGSNFVNDFQALSFCELKRFPNPVDLNSGLLSSDHGTQRFSSVPYRRLGYEMWEIMVHAVNWVTLRKPRGVWEDTVAERRNVTALVFSKQKSTENSMTCSASETSPRWALLVLMLTLQLI